MLAEIYTSEGCPYCKKAKSILGRLGIEYEETVLEFDTPEMDALIERTGHETVPQIFFGEHFIGGCDDLEELIQSDGLKQFLAGR